MANVLKMTMVAAIHSMRSAGLSCREIARRLGIHRETVSRYLNQGPEPISKPASAPIFPAGSPEAVAGFEAPAGPPRSPTSAASPRAGKLDRHHWLIGQASLVGWGVAGQASLKGRGKGQASSWEKQSILVASKDGRPSDARLGGQASRERATGAQRAASIRASTLAVIRWSRSSGPCGLV